jgi:hypothetical protein
MEIKIKGKATARSTYDDCHYDVMCCDAVGRQYWRNVHSTDFDAMLRLADKINERGYINSEHWECHVPYGSTAWDLDGHEFLLVQRESPNYL